MLAFLLPLFLGCFLLCIQQHLHHSGCWLHTAFFSFFFIFNGKKWCTKFRVIFYSFKAIFVDAVVRFFYLFSYICGAVALWRFSFHFSFSPLLNNTCHVSPIVSVRKQFKIIFTYNDLQWNTLLAQWRIVHVCPFLNRSQQPLWYWMDEWSDHHEPNDALFEIHSLKVHLTPLPIVLWLIRKTKAARKKTWRIGTWECRKFDIHLHWNSKE